MSICVNWDDTEKLFHHTFYNELRVAPEEHPVMVTEAPLTPAQHKEKLTQIMFETFQVRSFCLANQATLALLSEGVLNGLVVMCGAASTFVVPIFDCRANDAATRHLPIGGDTLIEYLMKILTERGYSFTTTAEREIVRDCMHKLCYVAPNFVAEMEKCRRSALEKSYELPDGQVISVENERFRAGEAFFSPSFLGMETPGLAETVAEAVFLCGDRGKEMLGNIYLAGGTSMLPGLGDRLAAELKLFFPEHAGDIKVTEPPTRKYNTWIGGSILSELSAFPEFCVTKEEYDAEGPTVIHRKCF